MRSLCVHQGVMTASNPVFAKYLCEEASQVTIIFDEEELHVDTYRLYSGRLQSVLREVLMYSLVDRAEHIWFADTRIYMALYMGAMMTIVMLAFMLLVCASLRMTL